MASYPLSAECCHLSDLEKERKSVVDEGEIVGGERKM